jgi:pyruvate/2-oxoglutarate dehydrogenase complex dihydrolipoamide dehydrogenase (E3) component
LTNIDILELTQLPEHLMIIGGVILAWNLVKCLGWEVVTIETEKID